METKPFKIRERMINAAVPNEYIESFWDSVSDGRWESDAYRVFDRHVDADTICYDLGAYVGFTCCYLAGMSKATHAFEPDPEAFRILEATATANGFPNLHLYPFAAGTEETTVQIMSAYSGANSGSSLLMLHPKTSWEVRMVDIGRFIDDTGKGGKVFMKIDIEGYEYRLMRLMLPVWRRHGATVFMALHPQILSRMVEGNSPWSKLRRRLALLWAHLPILRLQSAARTTRFASQEAGNVAFRILFDILLTGQLPEHRKELVFEF